MVDLSKYPTLLKFRAYAGDQEDAEAFDRELEEMRAHEWWLAANYVLSEAQADYNREFGRGAIQASLRSMANDLHEEGKRRYLTTSSPHSPKRPPP